MQTVCIPKIASHRKFTRNRTFLCGEGWVLETSEPKAYSSQKGMFFPESERTLRSTGEKFCSLLGLYRILEGSGDGGGRFLCLLVLRGRLYFFREAFEIILK